MIVNEPNGFYPQTSTRDFEKQIAHLARNYKVISLDEIVERVKNRGSLRRCVAITFDDGFRDNYENAYPILKKYNVPATIFLTTGYIEDGTAPWFIKLRYIFMRTKKTHFQLRVNDASISLPMRTRQEKFAASDRAMACLKDCPDKERLPMLDRLCEELGVADFEELNDLMLTWDQIKEMSENGISFGAHTVSHPVLSRISLEMANKEIKASMETIQISINRPVTTFAYPFGKKSNYNNDVFQVLNELGFKCAVTTNIAPNTLDTELYELNRYFPWDVCFVANSFAGRRQSYSIA
jgi:peptidoglycan/xylan/chitin deacetylase (PgdA/CDA1 family)